MTNRFQALLSNPHTTWSGVAYVLAEGFSMLGAIWIPSYAQQFKETADVIQAIAVGWLAYSAGDAAQGMAAQQRASDAIQAVHAVAKQLDPTAAELVAADTTVAALTEDKVEKA